MRICGGFRIGLFVPALLAGTLAFAGPAAAFERDVFEPAGFSPFGSFSHPTGVAVDSSTGEVLIADGSPGPSVVDIFGLEGGSAPKTLTGTGSETFEFEALPVGVAVDNDPASTSFHDVYITDVKHNVVDKFRQTGPGAYEYECQFNGWYGAGEEACHASGGAPAESFAFPIGATVDTQGDVYIASYGPGTGAVQEFNDIGRGVMQIQSGGGLLSGHPQAVAVDARGDLFVRNYSNGEVVELKRSSLTGAVESESSIPARTTAMATDLSSNSLYADLGPAIAEYLPASSGELELLQEFGAGLSDSLGVAVNDETHVVYATDAGNGNASAFVPKAVVVPDIKGACVVSGATQTTVDLSGEVNPLGTKEASYTIEYGPTEAYGQQAGAGELEGTGFKPVSAEVTGLAPGTLYYCRISATDKEGLAGGLLNRGPGDTFETLPLLPVVDEFPASASEVTTDSVIFHGFVDPGNGTTTYHFAYGLSAGNYTQVLPKIGIGSGTSPVVVEQAPPPASLKPNTTYHFALIATNAAGTTVGDDETFRTLPAGIPPEIPPILTTGPAEGISQTGAMLTGMVFPEGTPTLYSFELGTTTAYGTTIFGGEAGREGGLVNVAQAVGGLEPGVTYHFRLVAVNAAGTEVGPDRTFTTATYPVLVTQPATPALLAIPVFPPVKYPPLKPKKHGKGKPKKHGKSKKRPKAKKAKARAKRATV